MERPQKWSLEVTEGLSRQTLKDSTEAIIRQALLNGEMTPGEIYSANSLAAKLGISNAPAREAMMSLVSRGMLELVRNRGFRVVDLTEQDRREIYDLRCLIEVEAVRRAAAMELRDQDKGQLRYLARRTVELVPDMVRYLEADQTFHGTLVGLLGNRRWSEIVTNLRDQTRVNGSYTYMKEHDLLAQSAQQHVQIAEAVVVGDAERAAELMVGHLNYYSRPEAFH